MGTAVTGRHKIVPFLHLIAVQHPVERECHFRRQGITHFGVRDFCLDVGLDFGRGFRSAVVAPVVVRIAAPGAVDPEVFVMESDIGRDLPQFSTTECGSVFHLEEGGHIGKFRVGEERVVVPVAVTDRCDFFRLAAHDFRHTGNGVGGIAERRGLAAAVVIFLQKCRCLLTDFALLTALADFTQGTPAVQVVGIFGFGIDKITKEVLLRHPFAEHGLGAVERGFTQHVFLTGFLHSFDDLSAPIQDLIVIRQADHGDRRVNRLSAFHRLNTLGSMEPRLGDDGERIAIRFADFIEGGSQIFFADLAGTFEFFILILHAVLLRVTERHRIDQRVSCKKRRERLAETAETNETDFDTHVIFSL